MVEREPKKFLVELPHMSSCGDVSILFGRMLDKDTWRTNLKIIRICRHHHCLSCDNLQLCLLYITAVFAAISLEPSNLNADSMAPARRPFWRLCWPLDKRPTARVNWRARGLSIKTSFPINAKEEPLQSMICGNYSFSGDLCVWQAILSSWHRSLS